MSLSVQTRVSSGSDFSKDRSLPKHVTASHAGTTWRDTELTENDALSCRAMRLWANTDFTTINLLYFEPSVLFFVDTVQQVTRTLEQKTKTKKKKLTKNYKSLSVTFHTETLNISWENYKYLQSLRSFTSVLWSASVTLFSSKRNVGDVRRCVRVRVCAFVFFSCLFVWKCAVCVCGSLLVCFCQRRRAFSLSCTQDGPGADDASGF